MPEARTRHFGALRYEDDSVVSFPAGLPGFEHEKSFILIEQPSTKPLVFVQSLAGANLCFVTLPMLVVAPEYRLNVVPDDLQQLGFPSDRQPGIGTDVLCLAILSFEEGGPPTVNLLAPIVVNLSTRVAVQAIQPDSDYLLRHPFRPEELRCS
jgi:flagellar assembly factor FliW